MRRAVFHLVLSAALGLAATAPAATRRHGSATQASRAEARRLEREDPCAGLSRADRRACQADQTRDAKAGRARESAARRGADPCARLARSRRAACEREVEAADRADVLAATHRAPHGEPRPASTTPPRPASAAAIRHELQPSDLIGGLEAPGAAEAAASGGAPALRKRLGADAASPVAAGSDRAAAERRPTRLHEVVLEDGQSLADLAAATGVSVADLARLNGVASVDDVPTGTRLRLPSGARATASAPRMAVLPSAPETPPPPSAAAAALSTAATDYRHEQHTASVTPGSGPRPYASLGAEGAPAPSAPASGRGGRTQADALAAYAVASARAPRVADRAEATHDRFVWPLRAEVVSAYGEHGLGRRNDGVDLAARPGDAVRASAAGEVVYAGKEIAATGGNLVLLKHADGWVTAYSHLGRITVAMRQTVDQGQEIAETPDVAGASVHFEVRQPGAGGAKPVDPVSVLPSRSGNGETGRGD